MEREGGGGQRGGTICFPEFEQDYATLGTLIHCKNNMVILVFRKAERERERGGVFPY